MSAEPSPEQHFLPFIFSLLKLVAVKVGINGEQWFWKKTDGKNLPFSDSIFVIRLSGFPVRSCLCAKAEADGADAVEKQQLIGVDSAWSFLTSTWVLHSSIPCVESVQLESAHPWRPSLCPSTQFPWQHTVCCVCQTHRRKQLWKKMKEHFWDFV